MNYCHLKSQLGSNSASDINIPNHIQYEQLSSKLDGLHKHLVICVLSKVIFWGSKELFLITYPGVNTKHEAWNTFG